MLTISNTYFSQKQALSQGHPGTLPVPAKKINLICYDWGRESRLALCLSSARTDQHELNNSSAFCKVEYE
jgi:hypothetical protein